MDLRGNKMDNQNYYIPRFEELEQYPTEWLETEMFLRDFRIAKHVKDIPAFRNGIAQELNKQWLNERTVYLSKGKVLRNDY